MRNQAFDSIARFAKSIDWLLLAAALPIAAAGLVTMNSFTGADVFFDRQLMWLAAALIAFFAASFVDFRFLRRTGVVVALFAASLIVLAGTAAFAVATKGARSWIDFGGFSLQPSEPIKLVLIAVLAKYFSRRHVEIARYRHILVSGAYAFAVFALVALQPDFGSAVIVFCIWLFMVLVSGIPGRYLAVIGVAVAIMFAGAWSFAFKDYQKDRIRTFLNPLSDISGSGYNAYQSMVAVGSGGLFGKGVGYGTQSKLRFLPEYQTDFIFAAFAEEWGFVGVAMLLLLYAVVVWRIIANALLGATNFEILFGLGLAALFMAHFTINIGMNIGLLPVTGVTVPFMSYGGTHLMTEFLGLGVLMGMRRYSRAAHRDDLSREFLGA